MKKQLLSVSETIYNQAKRLSLILLVIMTTFAANATTRYVKQSGSGNGSSWINASGDLQEMINASSANDEIWVAAGVYKPIRPANNLTTIDLNNRNNAFVVKADVKLYGGFAGTETSLGARVLNPSSPSILSGDIGTAGANSDNCYHVVVSVGNVGAALLDGFTITGGNGDLPRPDAAVSIEVNGISFISIYGGGIYIEESSPTLTYITISENEVGLDGGGIYIKNAAPVLTHVTISGNTAIYGGGVSIENSSSPVMTDVTISGNTAITGGGGLNIEQPSSLIFTNVIIDGNTAGVYGGGVFSEGDSSENYINCLFLNNTGTYGGAFCSFANTDLGSSIFINCTFATSNRAENGNIITYSKNNGAVNPKEVQFLNCIIAKATEGNMFYGMGSNTTINDIVFKNTLTDYPAGSLGNNPANENNLENTNPLFVGGNNYHLQQASPAINAGNNSFNTTATDLGGNSRIIGNVIDLGAYEFLPPYAGIDKREIFTLILYPNPATDQITIDGLQAGEVISITDISGREQITRQTTGAKESITVKHLLPGVYLVCIKTNSHSPIQTLKLIKK